MRTNARERIRLTEDSPPLIQPGASPPNQEKPPSPSRCKEIPWGISLPSLSSAQLRRWYARHLEDCPACRRDARSPDGHANANTAWIHCLKEFYLPQLAQLADVDLITVARVLDSLALIPLLAETVKRRGQEVRAGKEE